MQSVLPYVRGIDFRNNEFDKGDFPQKAEKLSGIRWLNLDKTGIKYLPDELEHMTKLEEVSLRHNGLASLHGELAGLPNLKSVIASDNHLKNQGIPPSLFVHNDENSEDSQRPSELQILDLSKNRLTQIPKDLELARSLIVLNLSKNEITHINQRLFVQLVELMQLDLSHNMLEQLPPQMRRLIRLEHLNLSFNPLLHAQLRQIPSLTNLKSLNLANTGRNQANCPLSFETLVNLEEFSMADNNLDKIPDCVYTLTHKIKRMDLSNNNISDLPLHIDNWHPTLEVLNVSGNRVNSLPVSICRFGKLRKLYLNDNELEFDGLPPGIARLINLEFFYASRNRLELIPDSLLRCPKLKRLILNSNRLRTLPDSIHFMKDDDGKDLLERLDVRDNPDFIMPPIPEDTEEIKNTMYGVDFSLSSHLKAMNMDTGRDGDKEAISKSEERRKRKAFLRKMRLEQEDDAGNQDQVLQGMSKIAGAQQDLSTGENCGEGLKLESKQNWRKQMRGMQDNVDYTQLFGDDTDLIGKRPGLDIFHIENFYPVAVDETMFGKFYVGDCYIVLETAWNEDVGGLDHQLFYWIGSESSLDKQACAAMNAVYMRNMLHLTSRTTREEQDDESEEFVQVFGGEIQYIRGAAMASGFYMVEETVYITRLYVVESNKRLSLYSVPLDPASLNKRSVLLLDTGMKIYIYQGALAKAVKASKARLVAERINKQQRKNNAEIIHVRQGYEDHEFWKHFGGLDVGKLTESIELEKYKPKNLKLYKVVFGKGYLELTQINYKLSVAHKEIGLKKPSFLLTPDMWLKPGLLQNKHVYILDADSDIFVWEGRRANRFLKKAAIRLADELRAMISRPSFARVFCEKQGVETVCFKSHFHGWDDALKLDYTKAPDKAVEVKSAVEEASKETKVKNPADLKTLFLERRNPLADEESLMVMNNFNEDLEVMEAFVLEDKNFCALPRSEQGIFYSKDAYVYVCKYWVPKDDKSDAEDDAEDAGDKSDVGKNSDEESDDTDELETVVYFWEGMHAPHIGWLTFTFSLRKKLEMYSQGKFHVVRVKQQQEQIRFMSHFRQNFIIHNGKRRRRKPIKKKKGCLDKPVQPITHDYLSSVNTTLYEIRANGGLLSTRTVQIDCDIKNFNSSFCYILKVPFSASTSNPAAVVYGWIGRASPYYLQEILMPTIQKMFPQEEGQFATRYTHQLINEGEEPENFFWTGLGGKPENHDETPCYELDAPWALHSRLFRCTNENGFFAIKEKCLDFCQSDLDNSDVMLLDTGEILYMWIGGEASTMEIQFAVKSSQLYIQHLKSSKQQTRKIRFVKKGNEVQEFKKLFHGWRDFELNV